MGVIWDSHDAATVNGRPVLTGITNLLTPDFKANYGRMAQPMEYGGQGWNAVEWSPSLGLFVAVAGGGATVYRVMTSPDGITWTPRSAAEANTWTSIAWSPSLSLFAAVAASGTNRVMTSPDGIAWTPRSASEANSWNSIAWSPSLSLFAAVAASGTNRVMTSPDGITWTPRSAAEANLWKSVTWVSSLSLFVAVAASGTNRVMTSPDGITWTPRSAAAANSWQSVTWAASLSKLVACAYNGLSNSIMTSPDGTTWTGVSGPYGTLTAIAYSPVLGAILATNSAGQPATAYCYSTDAATWKVGSSLLPYSFAGTCPMASNSFVTVLIDYTTGHSLTLTR